jgi:hypothetical protein
VSAGEEALAAPVQALYSAAMRPLLWTVAGVLSGAACFGLVDGVLWSSASQNAYGLGNISATYLLLAFLAGWAVAARRAPLWACAASGLAVTCVALGAFYGWQVHHLTISSFGTYAGLRRYGTGGVVTGPVFGALGAAWSRRRAWWAVCTVGLAFMLEPVAWRAYEGFQLIPADVRHGELAVGTVLIAGGVVAALRRARASA